MIEALIQRLRAHAPGLEKRVEGAAALAALMDKGLPPRITPAAFVVPLGMTPRSEGEILGFFTQEVDRHYAVVLSMKLHDGTGARLSTEVEALLDQILGAVIGWTPTPTLTGVFRLRRIGLQRFAAGYASYQLDFSIPDQIRTAT